MTQGAGRGAMVPSLSGHRELVVVQKTELGEILLEVETRNKYAIYASDGSQVAFAAEQGKGFFATLMRAIMSHWRTFEIHLFTPNRQLAARAVHPFRWLWFNERLELRDVQGAYLGAIQRRFSIFTKSFDLLGPNNETLLTVSSPFWRLWTFEFMGGGQRQAIIEKKWSGMLREMFTDADTFRIGFDNPALTDAARWLLITAAIFIDLQYFENNKGISTVESVLDD